MPVWSPSDSVHELCSEQDLDDAAGIGAVFNTMDAGQVLTLHVAALPVALLAFLALHVFLIRLAITLPPLLIAAWLFVKQRRSTWWPFVWGFVFFAVFTFFVELVPYLPSYGGYVRYAIGILATILVGRYAMVAMQRYLERQRLAEQQSEAVRRQSLSYEHAIKSTNAGVCPGCERGFKVHEGQTNFCMHCGMKLYEHCPVCTSRRNAFVHFCPTCGTDKPDDASTRPADVTGLAPAV